MPTHRVTAQFNVVAQTPEDGKRPQAFYGDGLTVDIQLDIEADNLTMATVKAADEAIDKVAQQLGVTIVTDEAERPEPDQAS
ncbi:MAG TPA: hypothetical protein VMF31_10650 [Solirubrobacterales bacterium]|nr:hypothetical protein [Solirubrobacterales bacterium]